MTKYSLHSSPGPLIRRAHQIGMSICAEKFEGIDITPLQFSILWTLNQHPGIDQATLASGVALDRATCSNLVTRMEDKGLIRREVNPDNKRAKLVYMSPQGKKLLKKAEGPMLEVQKEFIAPLSKEEQKVFLNCITKLVDSYNETSRVSMKYLPLR